MAVMSHKGGGAVSERTPRERSLSDLRSRAEDPRGSTRKASVETFPRIITVAREFGAGGARIAARVAVEFGFQLWDDELLVHLARKADAELSAVREIDERQRILLQDVFSGSLRGARFTGSKYRTLLTHTVTELAKRGAAVIVGRGANFLVEPEQALRVRVVCPLRHRIDRHAREAQLDWAQAAQRVQHKDFERDRFVHQLCAEHAADPSHYDLIVNTRDLSDDAAARLITAAYRARFGPSAKQREDTYPELSASP
jgi:cytidylate kinase